MASGYFSCQTFKATVDLIVIVVLLSNCNLNFGRLSIISFFILVIFMIFLVIKFYSSTLYDFNHNRAILILLFALAPAFHFVVYIDNTASLPIIAGLTYINIVLYLVFSFFIFFSASIGLRKMNSLSNTSNTI